MEAILQDSTGRRVTVRVLVTVRVSVGVRVLIVGRRNCPRLKPLLLYERLSPGFHAPKYVETPCSWGETSFHLCSTVLAVP